MNITMKQSKLPTNITQPETIVAIPTAQLNNPLHGITLKTIVTNLVAHFGWAELAALIPVRCFSNDPSIASSLKFLRKTPWAREKVEALYTSTLKDFNQDNIEKS